MIRRGVRILVLPVGWLVVLVAAVACTRGPEAAPAAHRPPLRLTLDHLRHLAIPLTVRGREVRGVALYARAPDYRLTPSPARDGSEGVASVDDAARAAVVFLRAYERTGDPAARDDALGLLAFVAAMEQGDGEFLNFVDSGGRPNARVASGRKSMSYWGARSVWALGEAARVLGSGALDSAGLRAPLRRALARIARDTDDGRLLGGSATATAEALLGVLALERAEPSPANARLAAGLAGLLVPLSRGSTTAAPWGAFTDSARASWHAWGARSVAALASAGELLGRPDFIAAARREADGLWSHFLLAGSVPAAVAPDGTVSWYPQIAYGVSPVVEGLLALASATRERRYAVAAGLVASWFVGSNPARVAMYDTSSGRTFDGIDGKAAGGAQDAGQLITINRDAGAESTIEALLALQAVLGEPEAARYLEYRPSGSGQPSGTTSRGFGGVAASRDVTGPQGERLTLRRTAAGIRVAESRDTAEPVQLTYWPAASPAEVRLATRLVARWNAEHPDIQVRMQPLPAGRSSEEVLLAAIVARATPDVSSNVSSALLARLVRAGGVIRLDDRPATAARLAERVTPAMLASLRLPDGGIYAFPWKTNPELLLYNVDLLRAAGVVPPRTHRELLDALRRLARDRDGDGHVDQWGMWVTLKTTWYERFYDFYPLYLASSGGRTLVMRDSVVFENEAAVAALEVLRQGFRNGWLPRTNFSQGRDPLADGTVAMKIIGPWFVRELEEIKQPGFRFDAVPVPTSDVATPADRYAYADLRSIAVFSTTRHPDAAARFVAYLTSPEADRLLIEETSQLPYRRGLAGDRRFTRSLSRWPLLGTFAQYADRTRDLDVDPDIVEIFDVISEAYEAGAVFGTMPVRQALARAADEARRIVHAR